MSGELRDHLVAYFEDHHKILETDALQLLLDDTQPLALSRLLLEQAQPEALLVTREMVEGLLARRVRIAPGNRPREDRFVPEPSPIEPPAPPFELISEGFTESPSNPGPLEAYGALFNSRFHQLSRLLRGRSDLPNLRAMKELRPVEGRASVIGMIREIRQTAEKHHIILQVEDETSAIEVLVPKDSPAARTTFLPDEVIGLHLQLPRERGRLPRVLSVERPEVSLGRRTGRSSAPSRVMFLSDLHVGSRSFLGESWARLAAFLHGRGPEPELAQSIQHVVVAGDLVDGIGIYPKQERDLAIQDVYEQYVELGRRLRELPERLNIVVVPGNHDAVCPAEPQPSLPPTLRAHLPANVRPLANPSSFSLNGVVVEAYHGRSFDDLIPALPGASYARPTEVMKRMLAMRHLAPIYGGRTPLAPYARDGLVIDPTPDILVTGHAHTYGVDQYRGVLLLNASTWQAETEYQRMRNISPVPARAAVVDLATIRLVTLDFSGDVPQVGGPVG
jgi:DNA polymerase II small subunit